ncbi:UPF0182 family protein [Nocardioides sp.]|uniref:UPF0182 family membrane protein n=1 Tax=Nocardioides sp. TaxID=35761 RepID=UPI003516529D
MSDLFDDDPRRPGGGAATANRRPRALLITAAVVVVGIFGLTGFSAIYTDRLWYNSAGYGDVFSTLLWTRVGLFFVFGLVMGGIVAANIYLAYRFRPLFRPNSREQNNLDRYRDAVTPIRVWLVVAVAAVIGAFAGASGVGHWRTYLLWRNAQDFGTNDPYFDRDLGYYVFTLPWQHFVVDFLLASLVIGLLAGMVTHYLYGGIRLQATRDRLSGPAQVQLSVLLGLFVLVKAVDYYLDRFDLVTNQNSLFTGMNYTAENAVLPARNILVGVAAICAVLFFLNIWRRTWQLPSVGLALLALSAVLIGMIFPAIVQQFQVNPSEADKEEPYIQANIAATRQAYDLQDADSAPLDAASAAQTLPAELLQSNTRSVPLMDPKLVSPAFENLQQQRGYYSVAPVLDVDRYSIDGEDRALVLGVRELSQDGLEASSRNWSNLATVYTHGNGIIAAYANQRDKDGALSTSSDDQSAAPIEWAQGLSGEDDLSEELGDFESRIYYGEQSPDYSVVGKASSDDEDVELNLPVPGSDLGSTTTFDGPGDAGVGSAFNKLMFAIKFGEPNFLLSGRVNENSKVLFNRDPADRVEKVAPWLTVDADPYPAVVDGRILWILDGYTTTDRFPNSQRESFDTMIEDALQTNVGLQTLPTDEINYMRNAVKATVDAYTGEVTLYEWDETDPILRAWESAFPGTVKDKSEMSEQLLDHVRYPEDLFKVQRYQFARYHVTDARNWYENNDRWEVPVDPQSPGTYQAPYRLFVSDGEGGRNFALTSVYVPFNRDNLASFIQVNSDGTSEDYGTMRVVELANVDADSSNQTPGPGQVANEFVNNDAINSLLLPLRNSGARVTYGNMLTFPLNGEMMNVQPVYAQSQGTTASYPELRLVLVRYGEDVGYGSNLQEAIEVLFTDGGSVTPVDPGDGGDGGDNGNGTGTDNGSGNGDGTPSGSLQQRFDAALAAALQAFDDADAALADGDLATYADKVAEAQRKLEEVAALRDQLRARDGGAAADTPADTPSESASATPAG